MQCTNQTWVHLTRIRVACQTAFPASQCCGWSSKWDAVIVLHKEKIVFATSYATNKSSTVVFISNTSANQTGTTPHQWYPGLQHLQVIVAIHLRLQDIRGLWAKTIYMTNKACLRVQKWQQQRRKKKKTGQNTHWVWVKQAGSHNVRVGQQRRHSRRQVWRCFPCLDEAAYNQIILKWFYPDTSSISQVLFYTSLR